MAEYVTFYHSVVDAVLHTCTSVVLHHPTRLNGFAHCRPCSLSSLVLCPAIVHAGLYSVGLVDFSKQDVYYSCGVAMLSSDNKVVSDPLTAVPASIDKFLRCQRTLRTSTCAACNLR